MSQPPSRSHPDEQPHHPEQPFSGLPYPGQDSADVTAVFTAPSLLPGYAPDGDPADGPAPPPGYAQSGYLPVGGVHFPAAPAPPESRSRLVPIVLTSVAALVVLCVGGSALAFSFLKGKADELSGAPVRPAASSPAPQASKPPPDATVELITPTTLNGRPKLADSTTTRLTEALTKQLAQTPGVTTSVGAAYGSASEHNIVIVAAAALPVPDPDAGLAAVLGDGTEELTGIVTVPAGPLGGTAKCGNRRSSGVKWAVCAWADNHSIGTLLWKSKSINKAKKEFPELRAQVEKAG